MPPKKQEQSQLAQYKPCFILPIFTNGHKSASAGALSRPVNIKKNIDNAKIIQILKDKGLDPFITNGEINQKGRLFVCENLKTVCDQFIVSINKPVDPKKDTKKDAKKQSKKQETAVVENVVPPIEINNEKNCNDFFVFNSIPSSVEEVQKILEKQIRIDIVVLIKEKIKPGSRKPNYDLLNNNRSMVDMQKSLKQTQIDPNFLSKNQEQGSINYLSIANEIISVITEHRAKSKPESQYKNLIILQIPYYNDLSNPGNNQVNFIKDFFQKTCKCTKELEQYNTWKSTRKLKPMIQPIKEVVKKQVQVEQKVDKNKKGGKSGQPVFQTVEQTIYRRYEDEPENIKSDLKNYKKIKKIKTENKKIENSHNFKDNQSVYRDILNNMLDCFHNSKEIKQNSNPEQYKQRVSRISMQIKKSNECKPINKIRNETIINKLRNINYSKNVSMGNFLHFEYPKIQCLFTFMELVQKSNKIKGQCSKQELRLQYIINKIQNMVKQQSPKMSWNFQDRKFVQKLNKEQLQSIINEELLNDPQFFTGSLEAEGIKLLVCSRTNPPGRVLYHNTLLDEKVLPNFQIWKHNFISSPEKLKVEQFYDFLYEDAGNLSIRTKNMMPTDNTVVSDSMYSIGSKHFNLLKLSKDNTRFGITKNKLPNGNSAFLYWHEIQNHFRLRILKTKLHILGEKTHQEQKEGKNQDKIQKIQKMYTTLGVILEKKEKYMVKMDPNPIIYWENPKQQRVRKIDGLGEITSYRVDGSIHIYKSNGDISIYRNGRWKRIINNQQHFNGEVRKLELNVFHQGQNIIKIREDQTIIISDSDQTYKKIIFPDGTEIYENFNPNKQNSILKQKTREIKNPNDGPFIRINMPRDYNLNVIGYGSAFAYLGFKNLLERSYDGYVFEFIDYDFSSHYYTERFDKNGKIFTEEVRLITHRDGSMIKVNSRSGTIVYVSPSPHQLLTQETLNQRWLQTFTTPQHHGEGVFDIDLNIGHIENKDSQTNRFVAKVDERSESYIAVSFITEEEEDSSLFPNGFHIKQQNYFLPPPTNCIPPRIFTINQDGTGAEYLEQNQIGNMKAYTIVTEFQESKKILQYTRQTKPNTNYRNISFSKPINLQLFGLPDMLKTPKTKQSLIPVSFYDVEYRVIEQINWKSDYQNVITLQNQLRQEMEDKKNKRESRKQANSSGKNTKLQQRAQ